MSELGVQPSSSTEGAHKREDCVDDLNPRRFEFGGVTCPARGAYNTLLLLLMEKSSQKRQKCEFLRLESGSKHAT